MEEVASCTYTVSTERGTRKGVQGSTELGVNKRLNIVHVQREVCFINKTAHN